MLSALGELSAHIPHKQGFAGHATRFVDPAVGTAIGYNVSSGVEERGAVPVASFLTMRLHFCFLLILCNSSVPLQIVSRKKGARI